MIYAAIILLIAAVIICHLRDWKENKLTGRVNHSRAWKWKALFSIPAGIFFLINLTGWPVLFNSATILASGKASLLTATWFLFLFNELWGIRAYHTLFARSTAVGANISKFDRFVLHWPKLLYALFVICLVVGATIFYLW